MSKWTVHYSGYYSYDVEVEMPHQEGSEEDAIAVADLYEPTDEEFKYEPEKTEAWRIDE